MANMVKQLGSAFSFHVFTLNHDYRLATEILPGVPYDQWTDYQGKGRVYYASPQRLNAALIRRVLREVEPDIVYLNGFHEWYFVTVPLWLGKRPGRRVVMAPRGLLHAGALAIKPVRKHLYLRLFKVAGLHRHVRWHATDAQEVADIHKVFGSHAEVVLAQGTPDFSLLPPAPVVKVAGQLRLVSVSLLAPKKNLDTVLRVLAELNLSVCYDIYGPVYDAAYWADCLKRMEQMPPNVQVRYRGAIEPAIVKAAIAEAHFFILPTFGENFGHVIFESLSANRPLIISDQTPWRNLQQQQAGWDVALDNPENLKAAVQTAFDMNQTEYEAYVCGARRVAERFIAQSDTRAEYAKLFM